MSFIAKFLPFLLLATFLQTSALHAGDIEKFPKTIDKNCRGGGAKIFDECSDQVKLFRVALVRARKSNKTVLVSYGAEWCIWCHVFEAYINGKRSKFDYVYGGPDEPDARYRATLYEREQSDVSREAKALNDFVKRNFIVVHIENRLAPNGRLVLQKTGAAQHFSGGIPFIFAVDGKGKYVGHIRSKSVEVRRDTADWFRGYDRKKLLFHLHKLKESDF